MPVRVRFRRVHALELFEAGAKSVKLRCSQTRDRITEIGRCFWHDGNDQRVSAAHGNDDG